MIFRECNQTLLYIQPRFCPITYANIASNSLYNIIQGDLMGHAMMAIPVCNDAHSIQNKMKRLDELENHQLKERTM